MAAGRRPEDAQRELEALKDEALRLRAELSEKENQRRNLESQLAEERAMGELLPATSTSELERTLHHMLNRFTRYLQAERCLFMIHNPQTEVLSAQTLGIGFEIEQLEDMSFDSNGSLVWTAFTERQPFMVNDMDRPDAPDIERLAGLGVRNVLGVPLIWERRDEDQRVVERRAIGVLLVMNKRRNQPFSTEDSRILELLSRQSASVIVGAQLYIELREAKERLERTLESVVAGIIMVNKAGNIGLLNRTAQMAFCSGSDGVGKPYQKVVEHEDVRAIIATSLADFSEQSAEIEVSEPQDRIYDAQTALVRDENQNAVGVAAIFSDITEIRRLEQMKTDFVATVSHELRTPLTSIKGFVSTLLEDAGGYFDHDTRYEFYQIIDQECDRLRRLIDDLLNLSRIERGMALQPNWAKVKPPEIVARVVAAQQLYAENHQVLTDAADSLPSMVADEDKVDQILTNLVNNALKYSPDGGDIVVRAVSEGNEVLFSVGDQGIGIPADKLESVFDRFERIDTKETRTAGGTGLGLHLTKHLVEAHDGTVWVESEIGVGSTFFVRLPIYPPRAKDEGYAFDEIE